MSLIRPRVEVINSGGTLVNAVLYPYPCNLHAIHVVHAAGAAGVIQIFDSGTVPAEGSVPLMVHSVAANSDAVIEPLVNLYLQNGLYVCESTTVATKTLAADLHLFVWAMVETMDHVP